MPLFYSYFKLVAFFDTLFTKEPGISEVLAYFKEKEDEVRKKYQGQLF